MATFRNIGADALSLGVGGQVVDPDEVVDVPGVLVTETADAYVVGDEADTSSHRAFPKATWKIEDEGSDE